MVENKWKTVTLPKETVEKVTWQALKEYREFAQTICVDDGKVDEDIDWIKRGNPPRSDMLARTGFMVRMANLKHGLEEEGFLSYDEFDIKCKREEVEDRVHPRLLCDFREETLNF